MPVTNYQVFRPININKQLVGSLGLGTTNSQNTGGTMGSIGCNFTPYEVAATSNGSPLTGGMGMCAWGGGGSCGGVVNLKESNCGSYENCGTANEDYGGYLYCQGGGNNYFVAPFNSQTWASHGAGAGNAPSVSPGKPWSTLNQPQLYDAYTCRSYFDQYSNGRYWSNSKHNGWHICAVDFGNGSQGNYQDNSGGYRRGFYACAQ